MPPSIDEFFYDPLFGSGIFAVNRIVLMMLLMTGVLCLVFGLGFRRPQVVPRGLQNVLETGTEFVRTQIGDEVIGKEASRRFAPYLTALFFFILAMNITVDHPRASTCRSTAWPRCRCCSRSITWVIYNYQGAKTQGLRALRQGLAVPARHPGADLPARHADRVRLDVHPAADHAVHPTAGQHDRRPPHPRAVLQRLAPTCSWATRTGAGGRRSSGSARSSARSPSPSSRCWSPSCRPTSSPCSPRSTSPARSSRSTSDPHSRLQPRATAHG